MTGTEFRQRLFFFITFGILIILALLLVKPFFTTIIVSLISVIMLKPLYNSFAGQKIAKNRPWLAASLTLLTFSLMIIVPLYLVVRVTVTQLSGLIGQLAAVDWQEVLNSISQTLHMLPFWDGSMLTDGTAGNLLQEVVAGAGRAVADVAISLGASLPNFFMQAIIFIVLTASLLPLYDTLLEQTKEFSPLGSEISELYSIKTIAMVKSLILGVFLIAVLQGAAMGIVYWIAGLPYVLLLSLLSMALALIPMVGISWLVWGIAIVSILTGNWQTAAVVVAGFYGAVNWIDILLRPKLLSEDAHISFALFMLAIFGGLMWAGIMGLFYGPVIMLLLVTTVQIYMERYAKEDGSRIDQALNDLTSGHKEGEEAIPVEHQ